MLGERIRELRKQKGYSQETLSQQMDVVRQTISKWENGISVPDAEMLNRMSEILEVPVSVLLGENFSGTDMEDKTHDEIAKQLAILNDQLASNSVRKRKLIRRIIIGITVAVILFVAIYICAFIAYKSSKEHNQTLSQTTIECVLEGETYIYEVTYDQNHQILYAGGDAFIANHVQTEQYDDANILLAQIEDYFTERGGTYKIIDSE